MPIVDLSDVSIALFIAVMLFLLIIVPLISLGILRLVQGKRMVGLGLIGSGVIGYFIFKLTVGLIT